MARKPRPGDVVVIDAIPYIVAPSALPASIGSVYAESPFRREWVELDVTRVRWDRWRGLWRAQRTAVFLAGAS